MTYPNPRETKDRIRVGSLDSVLSGGYFWIWFSWLSWFWPVLGTFRDLIGVFSESLKAYDSVFGLVD